MTILRVGATEKYADGWGLAFGGTNAKEKESDEEKNYGEEKSGQKEKDCREEKDG